MQQETKQEIEKEKVILVGVSTDSTKSEVSQSLDELEELADTAGAVSVGRVMQSRQSVSPATYVGRGKVEEIRTMLYSTGAETVICDDELTPAQLKNLRDMLEVKIIDRTLLILDIFAERASSREGKIQVELAQLKYRASRLTGLGMSLSRQGGGIGTRGPGEKQLEVDRRLIHERIGALKRELAKVEKQRDTRRAKRQNEHIPVIAMVGYTNAGKSTLLNALTGSSVYAMNQLFATLDPTTRKCILPDRQEVLLTDTVGFINKLPHHLVEAFRSTLEEACYADLILHVADSSNPRIEEQVKVVYETLNQLGITEKPVITAFNKQDSIWAQPYLKDTRADKVVYISAATGEGFDTLYQAISEMINQDKIKIDYVFPFTEAKIVNRLRKEGQILKEEYTPDGIHITAYAPKWMQQYVQS